MVTLADDVTLLLKGCTRFEWILYKAFRASVGSEEWALNLYEPFSYSGFSYFCFGCFLVRTPQHIRVKQDNAAHC